MTDAQSGKGAAGGAPPPPNANNHSFGDLQKRGAIFTFDILVVAVLFGVAAWYACRTLPNGLGQSVPVLGLQGIFLEAMWFGALGGVVISLKGVFDHASGTGGWDGSYELWHYGRPVTGAIAGLMTVILLSLASSGNTSSDAHVNAYAIYAAAFTFGTQERRFFNLLYEIAKLVVQVPDDKKAGGIAIETIEPDTAGAGDVVLLRGRGFASGAKVKIGNGLLDKVTVASDGASIAGALPALLGAGPDPLDVILVNSDGTSTALLGKFKFKPAQGA